MIDPVQRREVLVALGAVLAGAAPWVAAQHARPPVRIVVPFPPGAATDAVGRMVALQLGARLERPFVVENKPGANTIIGSETVARAEPDGTTLLLTISSHASNAAVYRHLPYDTQRDFASVGLVGTTPSLIAVHPSVTARTLGELRELSRKLPQGISFGTAGHGSPPHLAGELLNASTGSRFIHVPYKGGAPAMNDVLAGHIPMLIGGLPTVAPNVKAGKLHAIAVTTGARSSVLPEVPTVSEAGVPGFDTGIWYALLTSARTPRAIIAGLNGALNQALQDPEFRRQLKDIGVEPGGGSPEEVDRFIRTEAALWKGVVDRSGIARIE